ncbi:hypothetical protein BSKO_11154 [Bryopsis sp. KO-2023]|nr:hypothetical protein BSKO_11154 [Bryopsis sp. KO-2023]
MSKHAMSDLLGLQGPHAIMKRVRDSTEGHGGGGEFLTVISTGSDQATAFLYVHYFFAFVGTGNHTSSGSSNVTEWLATGADLGNFFGRDREEHQEHTRPQGYSRYYSTLWDRQGISRDLDSSVDFQSYASLAAAWTTPSNTAGVIALPNSARIKASSPKVASDAARQGRQSHRDDSTGDGSTTSQERPIPTDGTLSERTQVVKKQLEELRESNFLSKCKNLLGVPVFGTHLPQHSDPQVHESFEGESTSSKLQVRIGKGADSDGSSQESYSPLARTGSNKDKIESTRETEAAIETGYGSFPVEVARGASLETIQTSNESEHGQIERPQSQTGRTEPKLGGHVYRYAHYDEFGSDESTADEVVLQRPQSGVEDYKADEFHARDYYASLNDCPADDHNEGKGVPDVDGRIENSGGVKIINQSQTSSGTDDLGTQFNDMSQASDKNHRKRSTTVSVPSSFFASASSQTTGEGYRGESQERFSSVSTECVRNVLESSSSEGVEKVSDERGCFNPMSAHTTGRTLHHGRKSIEKASFPDSDQENKVCSAGEKPPTAELTAENGIDTAIHTRALSVLGESRNFENEKERVKERIADIPTEISKASRDCEICADEPGNETRSANGGTIGIQTERESLILSKTKIRNKQEQARLDRSTQTSSMQPIPQGHNRVQLNDTKNQQSGTDWPSGVIPKELFDRFGLEGITNRATRIVPDQFHLHLHFAEKESSADTIVETGTEQRDYEVARNDKPPSGPSSQASIQHYPKSLPPEEEIQPRTLKEPCHRVQPGRPSISDSDGGIEGDENGEASWDALRSLCRTMGDTVQVACQKLSESEPTTDKDQSVHGNPHDNEHDAYRDESIRTETPRQSFLSQDYRPAQHARDHSNQFLRNEAPEVQKRYQREGLQDQQKDYEGYCKEPHHVRQRERSHFKRHHKDYNEKSRRNTSLGGSRSRNFRDRAYFVEDHARQNHNAFSTAAMERFAPNQRGMSVYASRDAAQSPYPQYMPSEQHFQPVDEHYGYPEAFVSDLNSLPHIFTPAVVDRSVHEADERWRVHQEHLMNRLRQVNIGSSGDIPRRGKSRHAASRNGSKGDPRAEGRMREEKRQSGSGKPGSSALKQVARDMEMLSHRLQNGSRK